MDCPAGATVVERVATILHWESTVQPKYGYQERAERGYIPTKSGRRSFHPLLAGGGAHAVVSGVSFPFGER